MRALDVLDIGTALFTFTPCEPFSFTPGESLFTFTPDGLFTFTEDDLIDELPIKLRDTRLSRTRSNGPDTPPGPTPAPVPWPVDADAREELASAGGGGASGVSVGVEEACAQRLIAKVDACRARARVPELVPHMWATPHVLRPEPHAWRTCTATYTAVLSRRLEHPLCKSEYSSA